MRTGGETRRGSEPVKYCRTCHKRLVRWRGRPRPSRVQAHDDGLRAGRLEDLTVFKGRQFCSPACYHQSLRKKAR